MAGGSNSRTLPLYLFPATLCNHDVDKRKIIHNTEVHASVFLNGERQEIEATSLARSRPEGGNHEIQQLHKRVLYCFVDVWGLAAAVGEAEGETAQQEAC